MSRYPRTSSLSSERSPSGSRRNNDISLNLYSQENGHWATMMYPSGRARGRMYHVRSDREVDQDRFSYDERDQNVESNLSYGRSILGRLSDGERGRAGSVLRDYGSRDENIPRYSQGGNCQTFVTGGLRRLEDEGLLSRGNADFFTRQHGRNGRDIASSLRDANRSWEPAPPRQRTRPPDARFREPESRQTTGRLNMGPFEDTIVRRARGRARSPSRGPRSRSRSTFGSSRR